MNNIFIKWFYDFIFKNFETRQDFRVRDQDENIHGEIFFETRRDFVLSRLAAPLESRKSHLRQRDKDRSRHYEEICTWLSNDQADHIAISTVFASFPSRIPLSSTRGTFARIRALTINAVNDCPVCRELLILPRSWVNVAIASGRLLLIFFFRQCKCFISNTTYPNNRYILQFFEE